MHFEVIFQLLMCGFDAEITPVVCTSGLENNEKVMRKYLKNNGKVIRKSVEVSCRHVCSCLFSWILVNRLVKS